MSLPSDLQKFLKTPIDENILYDTGNTPFISITFIDKNNNNETQEFSFGMFMSVNRKTKRATIASTHGLEGCIGLAKILSGTHLDKISRSPDNPGSTRTDYGYCDMIKLNNQIIIIIAVIASPNDFHHIFTYVKNKIEILILNYVT